MSTHSRFSPSKRHRWSICPGSVALEEQFPDEYSESAKDGTLTHALLEYCLKNNRYNAIDLIGETIDLGGDKLFVKDDRAERVQVALDYIKKRTDELGIVEVESELRVSPEWYIERNDAYGTIDVRIVSVDEIEIIDYKDGYQEVGVEGNKQLQHYAIATLAELRVTHANPPWKNLRVTIIQPKSKEKIKSTVHPVGLILTIVHELVSEIEEASKPNAPLVPGVEQCQFCKAKAVCPALKEKSLTSIGLKVESPESLVELASKKIDMLTDEKIGQILEAAPLIRSFLESVQEEAFSRLTNGKPVPGFKLVKGNGSRQWSLPEEKMIEKLKNMGVPKSAMFVSKFVSPAQAEKLSWAKKDGSVEKIGPSQLAMLKKEYISHLEGKLTIAPIGDPREEVKTDYSMLFSDVSVEVLPNWLT